MQVIRAAARHPDPAAHAPRRAPRPRRSTLSCAAAFSAIAGPTRRSALLPANHGAAAQLQGGWHAIRQRSD
eukprot:3924961-Prymnesium_polylepis.1